MPGPGTWLKTVFRETRVVQKSLYETRGNCFSGAVSSISGQSDPMDDRTS
jgi:hypothetical protein